MRLCVHPLARVGGRLAELQKQTLTHSLTHSLTYSLTHSFIHSFTHSLTHSHTRTSPTTPTHLVARNHISAGSHLVAPPHPLTLLLAITSAPDPTSSLIHEHSTTMCSIHSRAVPLSCAMGLIGTVMPASGGCVLSAAKNATHNSKRQQREIEREREKEEEDSHQGIHTVAARRIRDKNTQ